MNNNILHTGIQNFINKNIDTDIVSVLLKNSCFEGISAKELAQQIESKKKCREKLPTWFSTPKIYYPSKVTIEQTSSEITAHYKAKIVTGKTLLDLTGGFGVDSYFFSDRMEQVVHCEVNAELSKIAKHNFKLFGAGNVTTIAQDGIEFITTTDRHFDWIYVDPSRRNDAKGKVFLLEDCLPSVPENLRAFFKKTGNILIKTSPLLDFSAGIKALQLVKEIHVVAVKNEVKELLWVLTKNYRGPIAIKTINIKKATDEHFTFKLEDEKQLKGTTSYPSQYLYEPNAAIMKSGGFHSIAKAYHLKKLQEHTHLYTSDKLIGQFPGRKFKITDMVPYHKKTIQQLKIKKANISVRNFPESVAHIRKRYKIGDGSDLYLFFTKNCEGKNILIFCSKTD